MKRPVYRDEILFFTPVTFFLSFFLSFFLPFFFGATMVGTIYLDVPKILDEDLQTIAGHHPLLAIFFFLIGWVMLVLFNKPIDA